MRRGRAVSELSVRFGGYSVHQLLWLCCRQRSEHTSHRFTDYIRDGMHGRDGQQFRGLLHPEMGLRGERAGIRCRIRSDNSPPSWHPRSWAASLQIRRAGCPAAAAVRCPTSQSVSSAPFSPDFVPWIVSSRLVPSRILTSRMCIPTTISDECRHTASCYFVPDLPSLVWPRSSCPERRRPGL